MTISPLLTWWKIISKGQADRLEEGSALRWCLQREQHAARERRQGCHSAANHSSSLCFSCRCTLKVIKEHWNEIFWLASCFQRELLKNNYCAVFALEMKNASIQWERRSDFNWDHIKHSVEHFVMSVLIYVTSRHFGALFDSLATIIAVITELIATQRSPIVSDLVA